MNDPATSTFEQLCQFVRETALLQSVSELLGWDERTMLPSGAGEYRAEQMTHLSGMIHRRRTDPCLGRWLEELRAGALAADLHSDSGTTIRLVLRDYERQRKLPQSLVEELSRAAVLGQQAWAEANKTGDFPSFQPHLEKVLTLKRQEAEAVGYDDEPYDALLDEFEPGAKTVEVAEVLGALRQELAPLIAEIVDSGRRPNREILRGNYPAAQQEEFGRRGAAAIGFDFTRGRLDATHHPFCATMGPHDCRITTRYDEDFFPAAFFGILHEAGHGMFEQGLRSDQFGLPPGSYASLGIHESQSRLWENMVGRSRAFWQHFLPAARQTFPASLASVSLDEFYFAINDVRPSLIRVEADEATYNLHTIIRFELERELLNGDLAASDLPAAWNEKYRQYLGVEPSSDTEGALQDIHWSAALIGYFPTYTLGNLHATQFFQQADDDLGDLDKLFAEGEFKPLQEWLAEKIYRHGACYNAAELTSLVTGRPLSHRALVDYLGEKLAPLYGLD